MIGGGDVGLEKVEGLLLCDADVRLIAPDAVSELAGYAAEGSIAWERREFRDGDLDRAFLAIAATNDTDVNIAVSEGAERRAMLVNVVDVPHLQFHPAGDRAQRAAGDRDLHGRRLPALAKRMKREIGESYGEPYARLAVILNDHRAWAKDPPTYQDRKEFFEGIVNGDPDPVELIKGPRGRGAAADRGRQGAQRERLRQQVAAASGRQPAGSA